MANTNKFGEMTDPWGTPFLSCLLLHFCPQFSMCASFPVTQFANRFLRVNWSVDIFYETFTEMQENAHSSISVGFQVFLSFLRFGLTSDSSTTRIFQKIEKN